MIENFWMGMFKNGCGQSGHRTLKLTVSQKWVDGINWFFPRCTNSGMLIQWFLGGNGQNGHKNMLYLKNECINWADFLNAESDAMLFG